MNDSRRVVLAAHDAAVLAMLSGDDAHSLPRARICPCASSRRCVRSDARARRASRSGRAWRSPPFAGSVPASRPNGTSRSMPPQCRQSQNGSRARCRSCCVASGSTSPVYTLTGRAPGSWVTPALPILGWRCGRDDVGTPRGASRSRRKARPADQRGGLENAFGESILSLEPPTTAGRGRGKPFGFLLV